MAGKICESITLKLLLLLVSAVCSLASVDSNDINESAFSASKQNVISASPSLTPINDNLNSRQVTLAGVKSVSSGSNHNNKSKPLSEQAQPQQSSAADSPKPSAVPNLEGQSISSNDKPVVETSNEGSPARKKDRESDRGDRSPLFSLQTFVIISVTILIVLSNCAIIMVVAWTEAFSNFNKTFIYSLATADLLVGLFITPYSIFLSVYRSWVFGSDIFCSVEAYMFTTLISAKMYSLTWLNVDQYVAVRKPERYNSMMTPARSLCWILFSWVVVISFCCPPLFSFESAIFDKATFICMIDTKLQIAYVLTAGVLVCTPSIVAMLVTGAYLFTRSFKKQIQFYEKVFVDLAARPWNYHITFVMSVVFLGVWFPFACVYSIKYFLAWDVDPRLLFTLCWLGISTGFSQFVVLFIMSPDFRQALKELMRFPDFCRSPDAEVGDVGSSRANSATVNNSSRNSGGSACVGGFNYYPAMTSQQAEKFDVITAATQDSKMKAERRKQGHRSSKSSTSIRSAGSEDTHLISTGHQKSATLPNYRGSYYPSPAHV